jgi:carboxyl-terminal processing protease
MLQDLDPHSSYIKSEDLLSLNEPLEGNFEGVGIEFNIIGDTIVVISPISGGPSKALGIEAGDRILQIEDQLVAGIGVTNKEVIGLLRGPKGTTVSVSIKRRGTTALLEYNITRGQIPINSVEVSYMVNDSVGYIRISRFSATTYDEYMSAFSSFPQESIKGLVLDLRGNPGGYLSAATALSDEFLDAGELIVYTEGKAQPQRPYYSTDRGDFKTGKIIVLIDEGSASASEIVAGAIQDNDRGMILGRRSFGKGLVQQEFVLPDGSGLRLTIARYYTPTGRCIQRPYDKGLDTYYSEIYNRISKGDSLSSDSSYFADSLRFVTKGGKIVYGGGGIMPDLIVPIDTIEKNPFLNKVVNRGLINRFAFTYADKNRATLISDLNVDSFASHFSFSKAEYAGFVDFVNKQGVSVSAKESMVSSKIIQIRMKAYVARHVWGDSGYYRVIQKIDNAFKKALEEMSKK